VLQQYHWQHPTAPHDPSFQIWQVLFDNPCIFNWTTQDVPTIPKQLSNTDLLTKTSTNVIDDIITKGKETLTFRQPIPCMIKRIWFVENNQLTFITIIHTLDSLTVKILCLYQHTYHLSNILNFLSTSMVLLHNFYHHGLHASIDPIFSNFSEVSWMLLLKKGVMLHTCISIEMHVWKDLLSFSLSISNYLISFLSFIIQLIMHT
jgi:hypothetical protein